VGHVEGGVDGAAVGVLQSKNIVQGQQIAKKINRSNVVLNQRAFTESAFVNV